MALSTTSKSNKRSSNGARAAAIPVLQVFHVEPEGIFSKSSGLVRTFAPLRVEPDAVFFKARHSALINSELDVWLVKNGIRRLIVSGIRSEQCCETTARHASDLGYAVDYVSEATLTFPMVDGIGREWTAREILERTELVLADRFARIASVDQALGENHYVQTQPAFGGCHGGQAAA
jgi:nicotinamidase-related amidase